MAGWWQAVSTGSAFNQGQLWPCCHYTPPDYTPEPFHWVKLSAPSCCDNTNPPSSPGSSEGEIGYAPCLNDNTVTWSWLYYQTYWTPDKSCCDVPAPPPPGGPDVTQACLEDNNISLWVWTADGAKTTTPCLTDDENKIVWVWTIRTTTLSNALLSTDTSAGVEDITIWPSINGYWSVEGTVIDGEPVTVTETYGNAIYITRTSPANHAKGATVTYSFWQPQLKRGWRLPGCCDTYGSTFYKEQGTLTPPSTPGTYAGEKTITQCSSNNVINWVWNQGNFPNNAHPQTDVAQQCRCNIFCANWDCSNELEAYWDVQSGTATIEPDTPLFYGTSNWAWDGTKWNLNANNCLLNCTPNSSGLPVPTYDPIYGWYPNSFITACNGPSEHANQVRWKWHKDVQQWQIDYGSCVWNWVAGNATFYWTGSEWLPSSNPCGAVYPTIVPVYDSTTNTWIPDTTTTGCPGGTWELATNGCIDRCVPVRPTLVPWWNHSTNAWVPSSTTTSNCSTTHTSQFLGDPTYELGPYCLGGAYNYPDTVYNFTDYTQLATPCFPLQPDKPDDTTIDGQIAYTDCPTTNHLSMASNTKMLLRDGLKKTNNLFVTVQVLQPQPGDEFKIYFDGGNKYAYFKFGQWERGIDPSPPDDVKLFESYSHEWPNEGEIGIFDGSILRKKHSSNMFPNPTGNWWYGVWIHNNEAGNGVIATAVVGGNPILGGVPDYGIGYTNETMSARIDAFTDERVGLGTGQNTGTIIDKFSVQEAGRVWTNTDFTVTIGPDDSCYDSATSNHDHYVGSGFYSGCSQGSTERLGCIDGLAPTSITLQVDGFQPVWNWNIADTGHWGTSNTDPGNESAGWPIDYATTGACIGCPSASSLNGSYVLQRSDVCVTTSCGLGQYIYEGSISCGPFTITLDWNNYFLPNPISVNLAIYFHNRNTPLVKWNGSSYDENYVSYGDSIDSGFTTTKRFDCFNGLFGKTVNAPTAYGVQNWAYLSWPNTTSPITDGFGNVSYPPFAANGGIYKITGVHYHD